RVIVHPLYVMPLDIAPHRRADRRKEGRLAKFRELSESLEFVLHGLFEFGEAEDDPLRAQGLDKFGRPIGCAAIDAADWFRRRHAASRRGGRRRHRLEDALLEQFGVGEKQRRIPTEQHEARYAPGIGITRDIMIAPDAISAPEHR